MHRSRASALVLFAVALAYVASPAFAQGTCQYTIRAGDTFWSVANARGLTEASVVKLNPGVLPTALKVGQVINVPCSVTGGDDAADGDTDPPTGNPGGSGCTHTIKSGDTFWAIANARGMSVDALMSMNPGVSAERLQIGQTINVPCSGTGNPPTGNPPTGNPPTGDPPAEPKRVCAKSSYGRGVGTVPNQCPSDKPQLDAGLCYPNCPDASPMYRGVGPVCWQDCPSGYTDTGLTCHRWWPPHSTGKNSQTRGVGVVPQGCGNKENDAGLCYDKCQSGMKGIGPVCWGQCGGARPVDCGAFCARDSGSCADLGVRIGQTGVGLALTIVGCVGTGFAGCASAVGSSGQLGLEGLKALMELIDFEKNC